MRAGVDARKMPLTWRVAAIEQLGQIFLGGADSDIDDEWAGAYWSRCQQISVSTTSIFETLWKT